MKKAVSSLFFYFMVLSGIIFILYGYHLLLKKEIDIYRESIKKSDFYRIETIYNRHYLTEKIDLIEKNGKIYIHINGRKIPVYRIKSINSVNINAEVVKKVSRNGTMGIILAAVGGILIILSLILKDFI